jgi:isocitrate dehydrogenase
MMTSMLVNADGCFEFEAAHGTVTQHYYRYLRGEKTSTNPVAMIYAWSGALRKRAEFDGTPELAAFADRLEQAVMDTIAAGTVTGDLAALMEPKPASVDSWQFLAAVRKRLEAATEVAIS